MSWKKSTGARTGYELQEPHSCQSQTVTSHMSSYKDHQRYISYDLGCAVFICFFFFQMCLLFILQDLFVSRITKTITQKKTLQRKQKRGWFTKEQMQNTLGWTVLISQLFSVLISDFVMSKFTQQNTPSVSQPCLP